MSMGIQCMDESGLVYFDTANKNYYQLIGKLQSRGATIPDHARLTIPSQYNNNDHLFALNVIDQRSRVLGDKWYIGLFSEEGTIIFTHIGRQHVNDPSPALPSISVFSKLPPPVNPETFGVDCYDDNNNHSFSTFSSSSCLQITNFRRSNSPILGLIGQGNAVLISALPYSANASSPGYAQIQSSIWRRNGLQVEAGYGVIGSRRVGGGFSFPYFAAATIEIPAISIPNLPW